MQDRDSCNGRLIGNRVWPIKWLFQSNLDFFYLFTHRWIWSGAWLTWTDGRARVGLQAQAADVRRAQTQTGCGRRERGGQATIQRSEIVACDLQGHLLSETSPIYLTNCSLRIIDNVYRRIRKHTSLVILTLFENGLLKISQSRTLCCSFFRRPRTEGWPHHGCTFSIYLCPSVILIDSSRGVMSTCWCCP